jgi:hypothetical protein
MRVFIRSFSAVGILGARRDRSSLSGGSLPLPLTSNIRTSLRRTGFWAMVKQRMRDAATQIGLKLVRCSDVAG